MSKVTIQLTQDQQRQIKESTGKNIRELNIDLSATDSLTDKELDHMAGGAVDAFLKFTE